MGKKNKNKIQVLDSNQDLNALFNDEPENNSTDKNKPINTLDINKNTFSSHTSDPTPEPEMSDKEFAELLNISLKGKSMDRLLQEKNERGAPEKVPLSKSLSRWMFMIARSSRSLISLTNSF